MAPLSSFERAAIVVCIAVLGASCSSGHSSRRSSSTTTSTTGGAAAHCSTATHGHGWVRSDLRPVSQPFVAGCNFVVYDASGGALRVVALDAANGRTMWQARVTASGITPGVTPTLAVVGDTVAVIEGTAGSQMAQLVGLNASDGKTTWTSPRGVFTGWPAPCADDLTAICVTGSSGLQTQELRVNAATGAPLASPVVSPTPNGRDLAPNLFDPAIRNPDRLVAVSGGTVGWDHPLASVFNQPGLSTDWGWNFDRLPALGLFVGSVGGKPLSRTATTEVADLAGGMTAAFRIVDGAPVWRDPGSLYLCNVLPCAGSATPPGNGTAEVFRFGLRLRGTGIIHAAEGSAPVLSPDADFKLEGFDLHTGRTTWSFDVGRNLSLAENASPPQLTPEQVVLPGRNGQFTSLDLATGQHGNAPPGATLWCQKNTTYKLSTPHIDSSGNKANFYQGANAIFPCDEHAHTIKPPSAVPTFVGPSITGTVAWSDSSEVIAAPAAP